MKGKDFKLYNVFFPIWFVFIYPFAWIFVLPINLVIDFIVIYLTLKYLKIENKKVIAKSMILKTWIFGFISDLIGAGLMLITNMIPFSGNSKLYNWWYDNIISGVNYNPFINPFSLLYTLICVFVSSYFIYVLNKKFVLNKIDMDENSKHKLALSLAIFTAPILFLFPSGFLYGF